jgi:inorganic pyrophosphatase
MMEDEAGLDGKILAVPVDKLSSEYTHIQSAADIDPILIKQIEDFFTNYKKAEPGKWVKIQGWGDTDAARREITESVERYQTK